MLPQSLAMALALALLMALLPRLQSAPTYSQVDAINYLYLAISAYCGAPKFETTYLANWTCGPSCTGAGAVSDVTTFSDTSLGIFGFVGRYQGSCLLTFRGTFDSAGDATDTDWSLADYAGCSGCQVHQGLTKGYAAVKPAIVAALEGLQCSELALAGHSLGASLSVLATFDLGSSYTIKENYNFGAYRVGNSAFAAAYNAKYSALTHRVTHAKDPIPLGPLVSQGYEHVGGEVHYPGNVSQGYTLCQGNEDLSCSDQYCPPSTCGWLFLTLFAAGNAQSHLTYMQGVVSVMTDGESCTYLSTTRVAQQAALATAAYCPAADLRSWSCGKPCEKVKGGVQAVETFSLPIEVTLGDHRATTIQGTIKGFVGKWGDRCLLSLADPFGPAQGLAVLKTRQDLVDFGNNETCPGCNVHAVVKQAYDILAAPLRSALLRLGCWTGAAAAADRRLVVTGHGLGASLGSMSALEFKHGDGYSNGTFGIEVSAHFGAPRIGDKNWAAAYQLRLGGTLDRVTHHEDPFLQLPPVEKGFVHEAEEVFFDQAASGSPSSYTRCTADGEDSRCSMRWKGTVGPISDHTKYMQPLVDFDMSQSSCGHSFAAPLVV